MKAVITRDFEEASVETIPRPTPASDEVLVEVLRVQLSVTECLLYRGDKSFAYETVRERMEGGDGRVFGHEFCGRVVEVGSDVRGFEEGDRVYAPRKIPCNECGYCERGFAHLCENEDVIGFTRPGALAEYAAFPAVTLAKLPDEVSNAEGAAMQPLKGALRFVHGADLNTGDTVVVMGAGVMGNQCGQLALSLGAGTVFAVDVLEEKLARAADMGMIGINGRETDPVKEIRDRTDGVGADVVFEAVGGEQDRIPDGSDPFAQAFRIARRGGSVLPVGFITNNIEMDPQQIRSMGVTLLSPDRSPMRPSPNVDFGNLAPQLVASDRVSIDHFVTHDLRGLESFEESVDITLNKDEYEARGPAQMIVSE